MSRNRTVILTNMNVIAEQIRRRNLADAAIAAAIQKKEDAALKKLANQVKKATAEAAKLAVTSTAGAPSNANAVVATAPLAVPSRKRVAAEMATFCFCNEANDVDKAMIECCNKKCIFGRWFHPPCCNIAPNSVIPDVWYCCARCEAKSK